MEPVPGVIALAERAAWEQVLVRPERGADVSSQVFGDFSHLSFSVVLLQLMCLSVFSCWPAIGFQDFVALICLGEFLFFFPPLLGIQLHGLRFPFMPHAS